jgi:hypothetical protein
MQKKVLAIYYSQSGQLGEIIDSFTAPLIEAGVSVEKVNIKPVSDYKFPWTGKRFFEVMPDSVMGMPTALQPFQLKESHYDLIILGYQAWFLSPSIPANSLLQHPDFESILKNTTVITITGARNMWLSAYDRVRNSLIKAGANLVGNIALVDKHPNPVSFVTIFHWMIHGRKDRYLTVFPVPGVAEADIRYTETYGTIALSHLNSNDWTGLQQELVREKAVKINYGLMLVESKARWIFLAWARFIAKRKRKGPWLTVFKYYLFIAFFIGAPILYVLDAVFIRPFSSKKIRKEKQHYLGVN